MDLLPLSFLATPVLTWGETVDVELEELKKKREEKDKILKKL